MPGLREATATGVADSQKFFEEGQVAFKEGRYMDAFQAFEKAYRVNPLADIRYNQAVCLDKLGKRELAAGKYEEYLREKPDA